MKLGFLLLQPTPIQALSPFSITMASLFTNYKDSTIHEMSHFALMVLCGSASMVAVNCLSTNPSVSTHIESDLCAFLLSLAICSYNIVSSIVILIYTLNDCVTVIFLYCSICCYVYMYMSPVTLFGCK